MVVANLEDFAHGVEFTRQVRLLLDQFHPSNTIGIDLAEERFLSRVVLIAGAFILTAHFPICQQQLRADTLIHLFIGDGLDVFSLGADSGNFFVDIQRPDHEDPLKNLDKVIVTACY